MLLIDATVPTVRGLFFCSTHDHFEIESYSEMAAERASGERACVRRVFLLKLKVEFTIHRYNVHGTLQLSRKGLLIGQS
jgi:hypothetical protein